jgi:hypothetical protein
MQQSFGIRRASQSSLGKAFALLLVLLLFWSQWAVAMHACAGLATEAPTQTASHAAHDCDCPTESEDADNTRSALCKQHCETSGTSGAQQLVKPIVADQLPLQVAAAIPSAVLPLATSPTTRSVGLDSPAIPDPPFLRSLVLLI